MKPLAHLLKHDFRLLQRNNVIIISLLVTAVYVGVFKALANFGQVEQWLVLVIFNDPALLGFLFVGVMVLFEKNENTIQALAVSPMKVTHYVLSKSIALTIISIGCCFAMAVAGYGTHFYFFHFLMASGLTTLLFSFIGFIVVAGQSSFNTYILRAIGVLLLLSLPFLGYFDIVSRHWFILFPTQPAIDLFRLAFAEQFTYGQGVLAYGMAIAWCLITYGWAYQQIIKNFEKA